MRAETGRIVNGKLVMDDGRVFPEGAEVTLLIDEDDESTAALQASQEAEHERLRLERLFATLRKSGVVPS